ncbi:MAG TPA: hypothetical protein VGU23_08830 [Acidobacteriaceae bacterium]|nr:hypothetical protein [Acidobacteriaceae bacterium]
MKKLLCLCAALILTFAAVSAFAATDVSGTWNAEYTSPDGSVVLDFVCTLKQDGAKLTGSFADTQGNTPNITIDDGKIDGDKISFNVTYNGMIIHHEGTVNGDEIKLAEKSDSADFGGGSMTLKRAKPPVPPAAPAPAAAN